MDRRPLRAVEAAYLAFETRAAPMHMGALAIFEGEPLLDGERRLRIDDLRRGIVARLHLVPALRQRMVPTPFGGPVWSDDPDFDIRRHVHRVSVPPPGDEAELLQLCVDLQALPLDRTRPLWELWFVEGVSGGRVAMIEKIHHAMADGMAGVELAAVLLDVEPRSDIGDPEPWTPHPLPGLVDSALAKILSGARAPLRLGRRALHALRHPGAEAKNAAVLTRALTQMTWDGLHGGSRSLNQPVSDARRLLPVRLSLDAVKEVAHACSATVNDVVLACVTGGLRRLLDGRGEPVNQITLTAMAPVSLRGDGEALAMGNRTATLFVPLPVHERDPVRRLDLVSASAGRAKRLHEAEASDRLLGLLDLAPRVNAMGSRWVVPHQPFISLVITNMRGPGIPLYALGARMLEVFPIVPLGGNLDVGVAILSYDGSLAITVHADPHRCADAPVLAEGIEDSFAELVDASPMGVATSRERARGAAAHDRRRISA